MAKLEAVTKRMGDYLRAHSVKVVALGSAVGSSALAYGVHAETFNFSILTDLSAALVALMPDISTLINTGGPVIINFCIVAAVCGPFVWLAKKAGVF